MLDENVTVSSYDKRSFLSGIAVGRQLKGWATGGSGEGGGGGTGSISITENGEYDVKQYAVAVVDVPAGEEPTGSISMTENGTYDVKQYALAVVNVRQETLIRLPYEVLMLDDELIVVDTTALIAHVLPPYSDISLPYEALMLDSEIMLVAETDIVQV